jgi:hypothetical protein
MTDLATRCEQAEASDLGLEVLIEIALFKSCERYASIRANNAETKVVYTLHDGREETFWPDDWTMEERKADTIAALRAHAKDQADE